MDITSLSELDSMSQGDRKIQVKLSRKWLQTDPTTGNVSGANMILVDSYDNRMHCWIPLSLFSKMEAVFFQGSIYELQKFEVCTYTGKFRCFDSATHIVILPETIVIPLDDTYSNIAEHVFHFTTLSNVASADLKDSHLVDVAGIIEAVGVFVPVTRNNVVKHCYLDIVITDLITAVNARLWDHFAISFYNALKAATEHPVITILSCCQLKRNEYNGVCHVRNVAATEFHLNANVSYVQNLRKRSFFVTKTISTVSTIHRPNCYYVLQIFRCEWVMKCNLRFNIEHSFPVYYPPIEMTFNRGGVFMHWRLGAMNTSNEEAIPIDSVPARHVSRNILFDKTNIIDDLSGTKALEPKGRMCGNQLRCAVENCVPSSQQIPTSKLRAVDSNMKKKPASKKNAPLLMKENVEHDQRLPSKPKFKFLDSGIKKNNGRKKKTTASTLSNSKHRNDDCDVTPCRRDAIGSEEETIIVPALRTKTGKFNLA
ncbi:hypothetical protein DCAR_0832064 [Daucus carota subsp. sativus]|uniref:Uncharacterized protein n=1 Tax=Daucus carota subsp. sativus TaxID=79200 RepID=A0A175YPD4_DAUCS|nr:hypothetical protein DCAR_0832064 [Daucus carota subsp. sativus]